MAQREDVRRLWRVYEDFGRFASVTDAETMYLPRTVEEIRRELILYSIKDQVPDIREAAASLAELKRQALVAGLDFKALAREVADLSDDTRRDPTFGSTREMLLRYAVS